MTRSADVLRDLSVDTRAARESNFLNINVVNNIYAGTLLANGETNLGVVSGSPITYIGTFTFDGVGVSGLSVDMNIYTGAGCTGPEYSGFPLLSVAVTNGSGNYTWGLPDTRTNSGPTGTFYLETSSAGRYLSNCITVTVS